MCVERDKALCAIMGVALTASPDCRSHWELVSYIPGDIAILKYKHFEQRIWTTIISPDLTIWKVFTMFRQTANPTVTWPLIQFLSIFSWFHLQIIQSVEPKYIPDICHFFYTGRIFGERIYTKKRVNYNKRILRLSSVNCDLLGKANDECV